MAVSSAPSSVTDVDQDFRATPLTAGVLFCMLDAHAMATISVQSTPQGRPLVQLRQLRQEAGYSIRDLAERAFVSPSTVVRIEAGKVAQFRTIRRLAEALALKPSDLR